MATTITGLADLPRKDSALRIDVAGLAASEVSFVSLKSTRQDSTRTSSHFMRNPSSVVYECDQFPNDPVQVPTANFTSPLLIAWLISLLGAFQSGYSYGVTGALKEEYVFRGHTTLQWSIFVASVAVGGLIGSLVAGRVGTTWSRRRGVLISSSIYIIAGLLMGFATNIYMLIVGRFVVGLAAGSTAVFVPLYIRELSAPSLRGTLGSGYQVMATFGLLSGDLIALGFSGPYYSFQRPGWRFLLMFAAFVGVVQLLLLPFMPESPCWLVRENRLDEASAILSRLRGVSDVSNEIQSIYDALEQDKEQGHVGLRAVIRDYSIRRRLIVGCMLPIMQQLGGLGAIMFYSNQFFRDAGMQNPQIGTTLVGIINFLSPLAALALMDRAGRRPLLLGSCFGMTVSQVVLTLALVGLIPASTTVSVVFMISFVAFYEIGVGPITYLLIAELMPPAPRASAVSLSIMIQWTFQFIVGLVFPMMKAGLHNYSFLPFAAWNAFALAFTIAFVPETKGKTVDEIRDDMQRKQARM